MSSIQKESLQEKKLPAIEISFEKTWYLCEKFVEVKYKIKKFEELVKL